MKKQAKQLLQTTLRRRPLAPLAFACLFTLLPVTAISEDPEMHVGPEQSAALAVAEEPFKPSPIDSAPYDSTTLPSCPTEPTDTEPEAPQPPPEAQPPLAINQALAAMAATCSGETSAAYCKARGFRTVVATQVVKDTQVFIPACACPHVMDPSTEFLLPLPLPPYNGVKCVRFQGTLDATCAASQAT
jgi:hypothetical protein